MILEKIVKVSCSSVTVNTTWVLKFFDKGDSSSSSSKGIDTIIFAGKTIKRFTSIVLQKIKK